MPYGDRIVTIDYCDVHTATADAAAVSHVTASQCMTADEMKTSMHGLTGGSAALRGRRSRSWFQFPPP